MDATNANEQFCWSYAYPSIQQQFLFAEFCNFDDFWSFALTLGGYVAIPGQTQVVVGQIQLPHLGKTSGKVISTRDCRGSKDRTCANKQWKIDVEQKPLEVGSVSI